MTTTNTDLAKAYETQRQRLELHLSKMADHQVSDLAGREPRIAAELDRLRRKRKLNLNYRAAMLVAAALVAIASWFVYSAWHSSWSPDAILRAKVTGFSLMWIAICAGFLAMVVFPLVELTDDQLQLSAAVTIGGREVSAEEAEEIAQLIGEHPQFATYVQRWLEQGDGRLSIHEADLLKTAAILQSSVDACERELVEGGYPARLAQAVQAAAARVTANQAPV